MNSKKTKLVSLALLTTATASANTDISYLNVQKGVKLYGNPNEAKVILQDLNSRTKDVEIQKKIQRLDELIEQMQDPNFKMNIRIESSTCALTE